MLKERPGAFIFIGNGDTAGLHNPSYDFNDEALAYGISYLKLAEQRLQGDVSKFLAHHKCASERGFPKDHGLKAPLCVHVAQQDRAQDS